MRIRRSISRCCPNPDCCFNGQFGKGNIIYHSFYTTTQGRRRRYRCKKCGRTFSSTYGSPYYRLHKRRSLFDEVILMCVNGLGIKAMARTNRSLGAPFPAGLNWRRNTQNNSTNRKVLSSTNFKLMKLVHLLEVGQAQRQPCLLIVSRDDQY
jgi:hypothetical protein